MNPLLLIKPLLGLGSSLLGNPVAKLITEKTVGAITHKLEKDKIIKAKEIEAARDVDVAKIGVQLEQVRQTENSWKDEWFAVVLSLPLIGAFIPSMVPYVEQGFTVLSTMPDYYKAFLGGAIAASFGIKTLSTWGK